MMHLGFQIEGDYNELRIVENGLKDYNIEYEIYDFDIVLVNESDYAKAKDVIEGLCIDYVKVDANNTSRLLIYNSDIRDVEALLDANGIDYEWI